MTCCSASTGSCRTSSRVAPAWARSTLGSSKVANPTTLLVKYHQPFAVLPEMLSSVYFTMVPRDFDPKNPDGTGPFKYQSFTPGVTSTFVRNENYWHSGLPHLDAVVTTNIADETSQVNALQSGQVDVINFLSQGSVAALQSGGMHVNISDTGGWGPFTMRARPEAVRRRAGASGVPVDRRPPGDAQPGLRRSRARSATTCSASSTSPIRPICRSASRTSTRPSRC